MNDERFVQKGFHWLLTELKSSKEEVRSSAAEALGRASDARAIDPLIEALEDEDVDVRKSIAWALGEFGGEAVEALVKILDKSDDRNMRVNAACALSLMGDERGIRILVTEFKIAQQASIKTATREIPTSPSSIMAAIKAGTYPFDKVHMNRCKDLLSQIPPKDVGIEFEKLKLYDDAEEWYTLASMLEKAADMRQKKADLAAPKTIIQGDYVDDRDTIVKDSVLNRSNVGGRDDKLSKIKELKEMFDDGFISKKDMEQMKKEIIKR